MVKLTLYRASETVTYWQRNPEHVDNLGTYQLKEFVVLLDLESYPVSPDAQEWRIPNYN